MVCHICFTKVEARKIVLCNLKPTARETITKWYSICPDCIDQYPELISTFYRISKQHDDEGIGNHAAMFNLIDAIKEHRYGNRYIAPFRPGAVEFS